MLDSPITLIIAIKKTSIIFRQAYSITNFTPLKDHIRIETTSIEIRVRERAKYNN